MSEKYVRVPQGAKRTDFVAQTLLNSKYPNCNIECFFCGREGLIISTERLNCD